MTMYPAERRAVVTLSAILSLRMIGLFMVLPVFALYASTLSGFTPFLLGLSLGVYGLTQALCQIPFGTLSDHVGRKPVIAAGLVIFIVGSLLAGAAHSMLWLLIARALQGVGAVGSTLLALLSDLTRDNQRSKAMAIAGISIGIAFSLAMVLGPLLLKWLAFSWLFYLAALFGLFALLLLFFGVKGNASPKTHAHDPVSVANVLKLIFLPTLARLNLGIFILHAIFTASFIAIPLSLLQTAHLSTEQAWHLYLPTLLFAFIISIACIGMAERKQRVKTYFIASILLLMISELLLWLFSAHLFIFAIALLLFFSGFSTLEAFLPSLVSRAAPAGRKGAALGLYSCSQFLGIFVGGALGGWAYGRIGLTSIYFFCSLFLFCWFLFSFFMPAVVRSSSTPVSATN